MTEDEKREMEIDAELSEIYNGRYKRLQQAIIAVSVAVVIMCATVIILEYMKMRRGVPVNAP